MAKGFGRDGLAGTLASGRDEPDLKWYSRGMGERLTAPERSEAADEDTPRGRSRMLSRTRRTLCTLLQPGGLGIAGVPA